ncbi:type I restriction endonuclease subunit R [Muricoccus pecuniae]|uniref:Type I restriction enzyme R subunit n=1 Tax=Muricoccus pecuniae TaxID=693023 RepID=A0A840YI59_9PROT|nr:type I restriction endonuclease [Roseomonas pecuniae]MBB5693594.1 type I restriction enzyme R subunit [Roseomonas pecuniae]
MSIHKELAFEDGICAHLDGHDWLYEAKSADRYDRARALFPEDLAAWVQETQPDAWATLTKAHGASATTMLADRLRDALNKRGTLVVLRDGLDVLGLKTSLALCQFRPALAMNEALQARYAANRLRVVRQVRYSLHGQDCIDLVLFLNGIPVATVELKSDYTQSVADAVDQYRYDRPPRSLVGNKDEPLLSFPGGAVVHFAVSNSNVRMCTKLVGADSVFLPFDQGDNFGAGNPPNKFGAPTAYLWEQVWQRDSWLEILGRYVVAEKNEKKQLKSWLFPRFHQLKATRRLVASVRQEGAGGRYLIEHSAGSGKTNSIAWTAHFLADLHNDKNEKVFDTVLVVSDRTVLDKMLRETIEGFERTLGVVASVTGEGGSKSSELAKALGAGKKIVICTVQTFPWALDEVRKLAKTKGKRFAVVADEAHSSQSGKAAAELKTVLTAEEQADVVDGAEVSVEDLLAAKMAARADADTSITFVAFTATPKAKTIELFGRRPDPSRPAAKDNLPEAFDVYSMRQAIEEGFILDVLRNYTAYKMAFRLTHEGRDMDEKEVDASEARKGIMGWVRLHPTNIAARVQIVVEHFRQNVAHLLGGEAKAMVVTASRKEAVRWTKQMEAYIKKQGYGIGLLAAFSGEVTDTETPNGPFTETNMNPGLLGRDIKDAFKTTQYSILLVANKFQTGFDQPLLSAMYVDRKLGGIQAVQTLSRLNRALPAKGKDTTYVVDFVNEPEDILAAFRQYYRTAQLADVSNPNVVLDLRNKLDSLAYYDEHEVDRVARAVSKKNPTQADLDAAIGPVSNRLLTKFKQARQTTKDEPEGSKAHTDAKGEMDALLLFKQDLGTYVRVYEFLGQMFDYGNTYYEKLHLFARMLFPLLNYGREREGIDLSALRLSHHKMRDLGQQRLAVGGGEQVPLTPIIDAGSGSVQDRHKKRLSDIVQAINDLFEGDITEGDAVSYVETMKAKLMESPILLEQAAANGKEQFSNSPNLHEELIKAIIGAMEANQNMSRQALNSEAIQARMMSVLLGPAGLWEGLRGVAESSAVAAQ